MPTKKHLLLLSFSLLALSATAQDSTRSRFGFRSWGDISLLTNNSLHDIRDRMQQTGLDASGVGNRVYTTGFSFVRTSPKNTSETRLLLVNSENLDPASNQIDKRVTFYGYGFGTAFTRHLIYTKRFILGPTLGYDFMWYRLRILPQNSNNLAINNIVANPAFYNTVTFRQGFYWNLHAAISADYRFHWFKKYYDEFRLGARVGYQLPLVRTKNWRYGDGTVGDLPGFKSNNLFLQIGITAIPARRSKRRSEPAGLLGARR